MQRTTEVVQSLGWDTEDEGVSGPVRLLCDTYKNGIWSAGIRKE